MIRLILITRRPQPSRRMKNLPGKMPLLTAENSIALGACESWIRWSRDPASIRSLGAPASRLAEEQFPFGHMAGRCEPTCRETPRHRE